MTEQPRLIPSSPEAVYLLTLACTVLLADHFPSHGTPDERVAFREQTLDMVFELLDHVSLRLAIPRSNADV